MLGAKKTLPVPAALETWETDSLGVTEKEEEKPDQPKQKAVSKKKKASK